MALITSVVPLEFSKRKSDSWVGGGFLRESQREKLIKRLRHKEGEGRRGSTPFFWYELVLSVELCGFAERGRE